MGSDTKGPNFEHLWDTIQLVVTSRSPIILVSEQTWRLVNWHVLCKCSSDIHLVFGHIYPQQLILPTAAPTCSSEIDTDSWQTNPSAENPARNTVYTNVEEQKSNMLSPSTTVAKLIAKGLLSCIRELVMTAGAWCNHKEKMLPLKAIFSTQQKQSHQMTCQSIYVQTQKYTTTNRAMDLSSSQRTRSHPGVQQLNTFLTARYLSERFYPSRCKTLCNCFTKIRLPGPPCMQQVNP